MNPMSWFETVCNVHSDARWFGKTLKKCTLHSFQLNGFRVLPDSTKEPHLQRLGLPAKKFGLMENPLRNPVPKWAVEHTGLEPATF